MATLSIEQDALLVRLTRDEHAWGLLRDLRAPLAAVERVDVVTEGRAAVSGVRAPGLAGPKRLIGTFRSRGNKQYVCVHRRRPAVVITLDDQPYRTVVIGTDDAEAFAAQLRSSLPPRPASTSDVS
jgi:hypothetical protein